MKSSSVESRRTTAGRNLPPDLWWNSIRMKTTSPGRRVMDQQFVYRVIGSVCRLESPPASRAPGGVVCGGAPLEYDLNLFPRRNLRCNLRRNDNLTIRREFASEVGGLHLCSLTSYIISCVRDNGRPHTLRDLRSLFPAMSRFQACRLRLAIRRPVDNVAAPGPDLHVRHRTEPRRTSACHEERTPEVHQMVFYCMPENII